MHQAVQGPAATACGAGHSQARCERTTRGFWTRRLNFSPHRCRPGVFRPRPCCRRCNVTGNCHSPPTKVRIHLVWSGKSYFACGETRQAVEATNQALKFDPTDAEVFSTLGGYAHSEGDSKRAKDYFRRAKELAARSSRLSASRPGRLFSKDEGIERAEELAQLQSLDSITAAFKNAKPTVSLGRAATAGKHYSVAARIFQSLITKPDFNDTTGQVARLAVGVALRAVQDGLFGGSDLQTDAGAFHALARKWADEELNSVGGSAGVRGRTRTRTSRQ